MKAPSRRKRVVKIPEAFFSEMTKTVKTHSGETWLNPRQCMSLTKLSFFASVLTFLSFLFCYQYRETMY